MIQSEQMPKQLSLKNMIRKHKGKPTETNYVKGDKKEAKLFTEWLIMLDEQDNSNHKQSNDY